MLGNQAARIRKDVTQKARLNCKVEGLAETGDRPEAVPTNPHFIMALTKGLVSGLSFRSLIHFEFIFVCGVRK